MTRSASDRKRSSSVARLQWLLRVKQRPHTERIGRGCIDRYRNRMHMRCPEGLQRHDSRRPFGKGPKHPEPVAIAISQQDRTSEAVGLLDEQFCKTGETGMTQKGLGIPGWAKAEFEHVPVNGEDQSARPSLSRGGKCGGQPRSIGVIPGERLKCCFRVMRLKSVVGADK